jgi:pimeloyl-ACP methyl ester carboxylesterase
MTSIYRSEAGRHEVEALYRRALDRWPIPHERLVVPTCQGDTFVVASGPVSGPPVVLFHGSGANSSVWMGDGPTLSRGHRVFAVDMIGEPGFSASSRPSFASDAYAAWLDDVWDRLGLERAAIVGVSLGGWLALDYAVRRPRRVESLSLMAPAGIGRQRHLVLAAAGVLLACGDWGRRRALRLVAGASDVPREVATFVMAIFRHFKPRMERLPIRTDEELSALAMPVQAVLGAHDRLIRPAETRERLERLVRTLDLTYLQGDGHFVTSRANVVVDFLNRHEAVIP